MDSHHIYKRRGCHVKHQHDYPVIRQGGRFTKIIYLRVIKKLPLLFIFCNQYVDFYQELGCRITLTKGMSIVVYLGR